VAWEDVDWTRYGESEAHLFGHGWTADYPDPDNFLRVAVESFQAWGRWTNPIYDGLVARARGVTDPRERMRLYRQADRILIEEAVILPLRHGLGCFAMKPWVKPFTLLVGTSMGYGKDVFVEAH
jgi:ABC-type oligopeptide transport system substrate-binding subunit